MEKESKSFRGGFALTFVLVKVETEGKNQPEIQNLLKKINTTITEALEKSLGKKVTVVTTDIDIKFLTNQDLQNYIEQLQIIYKVIK